MRRNANSEASRVHEKTWPNQYVDELLSYLDSGVAFLDPAREEPRRRELEEVDEELAQHLSKAQLDCGGSLPLVHKYNAKHVRAKLSRLFAERKGTSEDDWRVIYKKGSACIHWPDDAERKERMARRANAIKHNWYCEFAESPRKTRANFQAAASPRSWPRTALRPALPKVKLDSARESIQGSSALDRKKSRLGSSSKYVRLVLSLYADIY